RRVRGEGNHHQHPLPPGHPRPPRVRRGQLRHRVPPQGTRDAARAPGSGAGRGGADLRGGGRVPAGCPEAPEPDPRRRPGLGTLRVADACAGEPPVSGPKRYVTRVRGAKDSVPVDIEDLGDGKYVLTLEGRRHTVDARVLEHGAVSLIVDSRSYDVELDESGDEVQVLVDADLRTV